MVKRQELKIGDVRYICGTSTKVEIVSYINSINPLCLILKAAPQSKFKKGSRYPIWRRNLWKRCEQPNGVINAWKKRKGIEHE